MIEGSDGPGIPPLAAGHFRREALSGALRLLSGGRVDEVEFFRLGLAGRVVAPNGRAFEVAFALGRSGELLDARCPCTPKQLPGALCVHLAALVLASSRPGPGPGPGAGLDGPAPRELPGQAFERSPWFRVAEALVETPPGRVPSRAPDAALSLTARERALVEKTRSPEEALLNGRGAKTRRQLFESSAWYVVAKRAFEAAPEVGPGTGPEPGIDIDIEIAAGIDKPSPLPRLELVSRSGKETFRIPLVPAAVDLLLREDPEFFSSRGQRVEGGARETLRITLERDGSLLLSPVYLVEGEGGSEPRDRDGAGATRFGPLLLLAGEGRFAAMRDSRRPFPERSVPAQAGFDFDETWRPSPAGVPLDRPTRIPADDVAPFLSRHRAELSEWPPILLPAELRAGGLGEPDDALLTVHGEEEGCAVLSLDYLVGERVVPFEPLLRSRRGRKVLHLAAGTALDPRDGRFAWMDSLAGGSVRGKGREARLSLAPLEVCRLRSYLPPAHRLAAARGVSLATLERLENLSPDTPAPPPEGFGLSLYDFQRTGYAWLWFLYRNGFGGLLCDDMGLGKTHQVMALLAAMQAEAGGKAPSVLVACPASVLPHWQEKLAAFLPGLPVRVHHGSGRGQAPDGEGVLLSTYGTLRNDAASISGGTRTFDLFVLDEIQSVKNRGTATHEALRTLRARVAIGLTGTPVENRVEELRTLLDFVLPGYLPGEAEFLRGFGRPIEAGDEGARDRLRRLVRPFVLRRTKEQVLPGLPEKIEDLRHCGMTPRQAELHAELLSSRGASLRGALEKGGAIPYIHVFALLDRLKQLCDHPDLLLPPGSPPSGETSGKWELFAELLDEALESGLKVVVFSQYLRMLDRIEAYLAERGIGFAGIRGATADRQAPLARFRDDPGCRVFVASLKAAGLGIDLTPASVVIHYDRWWNKAREDQATDRVHRIGQERGVQVLTLVTRGTVEERIDRIIEAKARLAADLVPEEDPRLLRRFTRDELRALLAL